jgi:hypothetical protein
MRVRRFSMASILRETVHAEARRRGGREVVHDTTQTFFESCRAEVDEETDLEIREAEIREELFAVHCREFLHGLDLDDHAVIDQQINPECVREQQAFVFEAEDFLSLDFESSLHEHASQYEFVNRFQQSRPKRSMNLNRRIDDRARNLV